MGLRQTLRILFVRPWWAWVLLVIDSIGRVDTIRQHVAGLPVVGGLDRFINGWGSLLIPILIFLILFSYARHGLGVIAREYPQRSSTSSGISGSLTFGARLLKTTRTGNDTAQLRFSVGNDKQWITVDKAPRAFRFTSPEGDIVRDLPFRFRWKAPPRVRFRRLIHGLPEPDIIVHRYEDGKGLEIEGHHLAGELTVEIDVYF